VRAEARRSTTDRGGGGTTDRGGGVALAAQDAAREPARVARPPAPRLSKDAYRRRKLAVEADLERLGARKAELDAALADPEVLGNFVELRRVTNEIVEVDAALVAAEEAWLVVEEGAP
jgi:hypothetical protein